MSWQVSIGSKLYHCIRVRGSTRPLAICFCRRLILVVLAALGALRSLSGGGTSSSLPWIRSVPRALLTEALHSPASQQDKGTLSNFA
jgi:hypothetical protein